MDKVINKKHEVPPKNSHNSFISKANADQAMRAKRLRKRQLQQIIEKNSKHAGAHIKKSKEKGDNLETDSVSSLISIPETPLLS